MKIIVLILSWLAFGTALGLLFDIFDNLVYLLISATFASVIIAVITGLIEKKSHQKHHNVDLKQIS